MKSIVNPIAFELLIHSVQMAKTTPVFLKEGYRLVLRRFTFDNFNNSEPCPFQSLNSSYCADYLIFCGLHDMYAVMWNSLLFKSSITVWITLTTLRADYRTSAIGKPRIISERVFTVVIPYLL